MIFLAAILATTMPMPGRAEAQVMVRIVSAARIVHGRADRPAGRGVIVIRDGDGPPQILRLVEFP